MSRKRHGDGLSHYGKIGDNISMERLIERLRAIGIDDETIAGIRTEEQALVLIALYDDRHEYVD